MSHGLMIETNDILSIHRKFQDQARSQGGSGGSRPPLKIKKKKKKKGGREREREEGEGGENP